MRNIFRFLRPRVGHKLGPMPQLSGKGDAGAFGLFTERARRVMVLAQQEAQRLDHGYLGTEHLLLGLLRERDGVAARTLAGLGVDLEATRSAVAAVVGRGPRPVRGALPVTPRVKQALGFAVAEARRLNHRFIGTEHLLLGLVEEGHGVAVGVLADQGVALPTVRAAVLRLLKPA